jgi:uncharacterized phage protein (TIGR02218 family)
MKFASAALQSHLAQGQTSVTTAMIITRTDGVIIGLTELDADIEVNGVNCLSYPGYSRLNLQNKQNLETTSVQVDGFIDGTIITRDDIIAQRYDYAAVQVFLVNWGDGTQGAMTLLTGSFATVTINEYGWSVELRGMSYQTTFVGGELCSPTCRVDLGSLGALAQTGTVESSDGFKNLTVSGITIGTTPASLNFNGGLLTWLTGANAGLSTEVSSITGAGALALQLDSLAEIAAGDTFSLSPGCDKTFNTCVVVFTNGINFQGEPDVPGDDHLLDYPDYLPPHS